METKCLRAILVMIFLILVGGFIIQGTTFAAEPYHLGIALGLLHLVLDLLLGHPQVLVVLPLL